MENGDQADKMENGIASPVQPAQATVSQSHSTYEMVKHNATDSDALTTGTMLSGSNFQTPNQSWRDMNTGK